jgi:hypothetical protein
MEHMPAAVRRKISLAVGLPGVTSLILFYVSFVNAENEFIGRRTFSLGLILMAVAVLLGPYLHWAWRTRRLEDRYEDEVADFRFTMHRNRTDIEALSLAFDHIQRQRAAGEGWVPPGPVPPRPPISLVRDEG